MARPRIVTLEQGEVSLSGFPKEVADALSEHIKAFGQPQIIVESGSILPESSTSLEDLPSRAIGIFKEGRDNKLVTVAYNVVSKQAVVTDVRQMFDVKEASTAFKVAADKLRFV